MILLALAHLDVAVLIGYLALTVGVGGLLASRGIGSDDFIAGGRAIPGWAVGLSMFGSYISSISFLANPGKSFASDWNAFAFTIAMPIAAAVAVAWFVPFYRRSGDVSAYVHLERRFGAWARTYAVVCFLLTQVARMATIVYLLALATAPLLGLPVPLLIGAIGALMVVYTLLGGIKATVWIGVVQSIVLLAGPALCLIFLLINVPGGMGQIVRDGAGAGKFSLGSFGASLSTSTFWVVFAYGLVINLGNFAIDQSYVQRYISTPDTAAARRSVWLTAALYVPVAAFFFFIGTALFVLHATRPNMFPADAMQRPDAVFPHFIATGLPAGLAGLVVAGVFAASMDSNLSSMATLTLCDVYKRYFRPSASERESMALLYGSTIGWGVLGTVGALAIAALTRDAAKNVLDVWWDFAGIFSGGILGLFLLGQIARRASRPAAVVGVAAGVVVILWITVSNKWPPERWSPALAPLRTTFHMNMAAVFGTLAVLLVGLLISGILRRPQRVEGPVPVIAAD